MGSLLKAEHSSSICSQINDGGSGMHYCADCGRTEAPSNPCSGSGSPASESRL